MTGTTSYSASYPTVCQQCASSCGSSAAVRTRGADPVRVFVSYAHDSDDHKANVLRFGHFLAGCGIDVRMDRWHLETRRDWQLWATRQILAADFTLVIASRACKLVGDGQNLPGTNRGLQSEMRLLRELYHANPEAWIPKILPVILPGGSVADIPLFLQPRTADHFRVNSYSPEGAEDLLRVLLGKPPFEPAPLGQVPDLPPHSHSDTGTRPLRHP